MRFRKDDEKDLLKLEARYCSYGDTVHYAEAPPLFDSCEGSWLYNLRGTPYLDMQMWYSAVNFGYRNPEISEAHHRQMQIAVDGRRLEVDHQHEEGDELEHHVQHGR